MDTDTQAKLTMILILLAIIFILKAVNATSWNGGYCSCGGAWRYQQAIGHRFETTFLYQCDKCIVELYYCYQMLHYNNHKYSIDA